MTQQRMRHVGFALTVMVIVASVAVLNVGVVPAAAECRKSNGGGGGGGGSPSPTTSGSPSASAGESPSSEAARNLPIAAQTTGSPSPSGSSTRGGGLPVNPTSLLGDDEETATPTSSGRPPGGTSGQRCPTKVTIDYERSGATSAAADFFGAVRSPNGKCKKGRDVVLKKDRRKGKDPIVGSTVSKRKGKWRIREPRARGRYYAKAKPRKLSGILCEAGRSKTIRV